MSVKKNIVANYAGQGWAALMSLAFIPLYIEYLGIEAYGLIGFFAMLQAWLALLDLGMVPTLNREMARFSGGAHTSQQVGDLLRTLELICYGTAAIIGLAIWGLAEWLASEWLQANRLAPETVARAIAIMGAVVGLRFVESLYRSALLGLQRQVFFNLVNAGFSTLRYVGAVGVLAWVSPTIEAFFIWQGAVSVISILVLAKAVHGSLPAPPRSPSFSLAVLREIKGFAGGVMAATLLALLLTQVDKMLLSRLLSLEDFGYYTLAGTIAGIVSLLINPIAQAVYPHMAKLAAQGGEDGLVGVYHNAAQLLTVMASPMALMICIFGDSVVFAWSGDPVLAERTGAVLSVLVIGNLLSGLMVIPFMLQFAHGWVGFAVRFNLVAVMVIIPAIVYVVPRFGIIGAAWIWVALNVGYILVGIQLMHRRFMPGEKWSWYSRDVALPLAGALAVCLLAALFSPARFGDRVLWSIFLVLGTLLAFAASVASAPRVRAQILSRLMDKAPA